MKKKPKKNYWLYVLGGFLFLQIFWVNFEGPDTPLKDDFITLHQPPDKVEETLIRACYDCHSNVTRTPVYGHIAPLSWWLKHHVNEGREELNFSEWGTYSDKKKEHQIEECIELVKEGEMPLKSYTWTHKDAILRPEQKDSLLHFLEDARRLAHLQVMGYE